MVLASGNRSTLTFCRESSGNGTLGTRGVTPPGLLAAVVNLATTAFASDDDVRLTRASGSFYTSGFLVGQEVETYDFSTAAHNGVWVVKSIESATQIRLHDPDNVWSTASADTSAKVIIKLSTFRSTNRNINHEADTLKSTELQTTGTAAGLQATAFRGFGRVKGSIGFQVSSRDFDQIFELALESSAQATPYTVGTVAIASTSSISGGSATFVTDGARVGDRVSLSSSATASNDGQYIITSVAETSMSLVAVSGATNLTGSGATTVAMVGKRTDMQSAVDTFAIQRAFPDITQAQLFNGCSINKLRLSISPSSVVNGSADILGMTWARAAISSVSSRAAVPVSSREPYSVFDGVILEGNSIIGTISSLSFTIDRNRKVSSDVSSTTATGVLGGTGEVKGLVSAYFEDSSLIDKFILGSETSITVSLQDPDDSGEFLSITFPKIVYTGAKMDPRAGGVLVDLPFIALAKKDLAAPVGTKVTTGLTFQRGNYLQMISL